MNAFEQALDIYVAIKTDIALADALAVGDEEVIDIPNADHLNALVIPGHGGRRFRIEGLKIKREK